MLDRTTAIIEWGVAEQLHSGAQLFVWQSGRVITELAIGESRPGIPMTSESIVLWLSATKPIAAVAIMQLIERGLAALDDPVARHLPEFAPGGKQEITIRHLLTHTGGFRSVDSGWPAASWDEIIARICAARVERGWIPGQKAGYHIFTSWYILGELVRRLDGREYSQYVRQEIFEPLGMHDSWVGMPAEQYAAYGDCVAVLPDTDKPRGAGGWPLHRYSSLAGATSCIPGASGYGPMRELGRLYQMLLGGGEREGVRILQPESVRQMTARQREGMFDETFKHVIDWGLGLIINSERYGSPTLPYGYGRHASESTFGHSGSQSSIAMADPAHQLVIAAYLNGTPGEARHLSRMRAVCQAIYEDLGLT